MDYSYPISLNPLVQMALALATCLFIILSFPSFNCWWLAWIALTPATILCTSLKPPGSSLWGLFMGVLISWGIFYWIFKVPGFGFIQAFVLSFIMGLSLAIWCGSISWFWNNSKGEDLLPLFASSLWVLLDFVHNHAGFLSFSWATLARSQHSQPVIIQIAEITGEYGITFLLVLAGTSLALVLIKKSLKQAALVALITTLVISFGFYRLNFPLASSGALRVAVIQPSILLSERKKACQRLEALSRKAATFRPDLIIWPETAVRNLNGHPELKEWLKDLASQMDAAILIGASAFVKFAKDNQANAQSPLYEFKQYNDAYFFDPSDNTFAPYHKRLPVPFGEYLPLATVIPWPKWLVSKPMKCLSGNSTKIYPVGQVARVSPIICWENLFPGFFAKVIRSGANVVAHLVNDNWFGNTAAPYQHNMASVLRAVENRVPVLVASNTGPSEIIDAYGRVVNAASKPFSPQAISAKVSIPKSRGLFTKIGEWFPLLCGVIVVGLPFAHRKIRN